MARAARPHALAPAPIAAARLACLAASPYCLRPYAICARPYAPPAAAFLSPLVVARKNAVSACAERPAALWICAMRSHSAPDIAPPGAGVGAAGALAVF